MDESLKNDIKEILIKSLSSTPPFLILAGIIFLCIKIIPSINKVIDLAIQQKPPNSYFLFGLAALFIIFPIILILLTPHLLRLATELTLSLPKRQHPIDKKGMKKERNKVVKKSNVYIDSSLKTAKEKLNQANKYLSANDSDMAYNLFLEAAQHFEKIFNIDPRCIPAKLGFGKSQEGIGRIKRSVYFLENARGQYEEVEKACGEMLLKKPENITAHICLEEAAKLKHIITTELNKIGTEEQDKKRKEFSLDLQ